MSCCLLCYWRKMKEEEAWRKKKGGKKTEGSQNSQDGHYTVRKWEKDILWLGGVDSLSSLRNKTENSGSAQKTGVYGCVLLSHLEGQEL